MEPAMPPILLTAGRRARLAPRHPINKYLMEVPPLCDRFRPHYSMRWRWRQSWREAWRGMQAAKRQGLSYLEPLDPELGRRDQQTRLVLKAV